MNKVIKILLFVVMIAAFVLLAVKYKITLDENRSLKEQCVIINEKQIDESLLEHITLLNSSDDLIQKIDFKDIKIVFVEDVSTQINNDNKINDNVIKKISISYLIVLKCQGKNEEEFTYTMPRVYQDIVVSAPIPKVKHRD